MRRFKNVCATFISIYLIHVVFFETRASIKLLIIFFINHSVYKISENNGKYPSQFPRAHSQFIKMSCFD